MRITLSCALSADGFLGDSTDRRLILSTPEDWAEVYRLRAAHDAILVGAETVRRDDPSLLIRDDAVRARRRQEGRCPDIAKVTLTRSGQLPSDRRFFREGEAERYVFSNVQIPDINSVATVIESDASITAAHIVTELEKRGIRSLFVEGGAQILRLFLREGLADVVRVARNPQIRAGELGRGRFEFAPPAGTPAPKQERFGGMEVTTWTLHPDTTADDRRFIREAIAVSRKCAPCASCYRVGAVVVTPDGRRFTGYTHESSPTHHAEQEAIAKAQAAGAVLRDGAIYTSMEPCSKRASEPHSCTEWILRHGFAHVAFALYEPDRFVACRGAEALREAGVDVRAYPELGEEVRAVNAHLGI